MSNTSPPVKLLFAESLADEIAPDWRYRLVLPYIQHSPSYQAVISKYRGNKVAANALPHDEQAILDVAYWLGILSMDTREKNADEARWLKFAKDNFYGYSKPVPSVGHTFTEANQSSLLASTDLDYPCIMLRVPLTLTMSDALKQIKNIFHFHMHEHGLQFGVPLPDGYIGQYKLEPSRFRRSTLVKGVDALTMYKAGTPLWKIGNELELSTKNKIKNDGAGMDQDELARRKRVLSIMAKRLVDTALLIAENAARGRFPCDKPFPEAMLDAYTRKAGRPVGSKRPKRINVRAA